MGNKLSREIINDRLKDRDIRLIGEYIGARSHCLFTCEKGHTWTATPDSVVRGNGCPHCAGNAILSESDIRSLLSERNIQITTSFKRTKDRATFQCVNGHTWSTTVNSVLQGHDCPYCKGMILTADDWHDRFKNTDLSMIGDYISSYTKTEFICSNGHITSKTPSNALSSGCADCARYGFKSNEIGYGYVLIFGEFLKFGITKDVERRLREIERKSTGPIVNFISRQFSLGSIAREWENHIKSKFPCGVVSSDEHQDGWTETCDIVHKDTIIKILNEWRDE